MKYIKGFLYFILTLVMLLLGLIFACVCNPELSVKIGNVLYRNPRANIKVQADVTQNPGSDTDTQLMPTGQVTIPMEPSQDEEVNPYADEFKASDISSTGLDSTYVSPNESKIVVPSELAGKTGYKTVSVELEQIPEEKAQELKRQADYGYTGDDLTFDPLFYPYYEMLNDKGKHVYRQIFANGQALYTKFDLIEDVTQAELKNIFSAVTNDHPELFWMDTAYGSLVTPRGICAQMELKLNRTANNLTDSILEFQAGSDSIINNAMSLPNDYEKEKYVHNALAEKIRYNLASEMNQSAYSALANNETVCAGYAKAFQYIMQKLGVPCYYCVGYAGENHAWNIICLDDEYYNVDLTWDDQNPLIYDYFNKSDADYAKDHARKELSVYLPPCNGQRYKDLETNPENSDINNAETDNDENGLNVDQNETYINPDEIIDNQNNESQDEIVLYIITDGY